MRFALIEVFPDKKFIARTLLILRVNDAEEQIRAMLAFINQKGETYGT
jgi:pyruvate-formate lyase-activating enzyme